MQLRRVERTGVHADSFNCAGQAMWDLARGPACAGLCAVVNGVILV